MVAYFPHGFERYLSGGLLIGCGVALLFITTGRLGGASTFFSAIWGYLLRAPFFQQPLLRDSRGWRVRYALGMVLGGGLMLLLGLAQPHTALPAWKLLLGGLLVGFGARLGGGCTSGHGICGMASLSWGSLLIVLTFLATAIVTAQLFTFWGL
ncbi:YeeE/YedE family protein [Vogesella oryzae]|uniref:YeeE/YedE family protein n=1 Tax=Vogesella oryzae TaxID=1735285 RepID=UPI001582279D|nr:YeeE/YedE thiosulfate transporter family protein [Vogesella oryzae]